MTATETIIRALIALLEAASGLPTVRRNIALDQLADEAQELDGSTTLSALVIADGENVQSTRLLGTPPQWELVHRVEIDWACAGTPGDNLEATFDDGLKAIFDAIAADLTLGGTVTACECDTPPERGLEIWGAKTAKTAMLFVTITYLSTRPF